MSILDELLAGIEGDLTKSASVTAAPSAGDALTAAISANPFEDGVTFANDLIKQASASNSLNQGETMNAESKTLALVNSVLEKLASAEETNTPAGIPAGVVPNKAQADTAGLVASHEAAVTPMPQGTVTQQLEALTQAALARGASNANITPVTGVQEGAGVVANPAELGFENEEQEKAAAVYALAAQGVDFADAVEMVKQASFEIEYEEDQMAKQAAVGELCAAGMDFDLAVEMVKQAADKGDFGDVVSGAYLSPAYMDRKIAKQYGTTTGRNTGQVIGRHLGGNFRAVGRALAEGTVGGLGGAGAGAGVGAAIATLARKDVRSGAALGSLIGGALGYTGGSLHGGYRSYINQANEAHDRYSAKAEQEKKAALDELMARGVNFEDAVLAVSQAAQDVYGA